MSKQAQVGQAIVRTVMLDGITGRQVRVEADVQRGLPAFAMVGLPDASVRESRERIRASFTNSGFDFPIKRVAVNLAPASLRKSGPALDLPVAAGLLIASGQVGWEDVSRVVIVGELALDGTVRAVPGALSMAEAARDAGAETIVLPAANGREAALVDGIDVVTIDCLSQLVDVAKGSRPRRPDPLTLAAFPQHPGVPDMADLRGQPHTRSALEAAAAGGHHLLLVGPPGAGKSLAASRLPSILPPLGSAEALEVARIYSACGRLGDDYRGGRPFRAPHHAISPTGLIGGGKPPRPGELTLAHRGVLFLDELCEFRRETLEALRAPLESGWVSVSRAGARCRLPSRFTLIAASNPCPCGRGEADPDCSCSPPSVRRYQRRLSGALAGQLDMLVAIRQPSAEEIGGPPGESSAAIRDRVVRARARQEDRLGVGRCNAEMTSAELRECAVDQNARSLLVSVCSESGDDAVVERVLRIARTLADLAGVDSVSEHQAAQASTLRRRK